jgi:hypothetical protein
MATSGVITFSKNAGETVTFALKLIGALNAHDQTVNANDMADGLVMLNFMLKEWQTTGPNLWRAERGSVTLVSDIATYTFSPRPVKVYSVRYRDTNGRDLPMEELTGEEYDELPLKTSNGIPTTYWIDKGTTATTISIWPVLKTATTQTLQYTYQRVVEDVTLTTNDIDVPQETLPMVTYNLAARLLDMDGDSTPTAQRIIARAEQMRAQYDAFDREQFVRFEPNMRVYR